MQTPFVHQWVPHFIQLGDLFISTTDSNIVYVDFTDQDTCMLVLRSMDKEKYRSPDLSQAIVSEHILFRAESREYQALRQWLIEHSMVLVPQHERIVEGGSDE